MEEPNNGLHENRNMEEDISEDRHLWRLGVDGWLLAVIIINYAAYQQVEGLMEDTYFD